MIQREDVQNHLVFIHTKNGPSGEELARYFIGCRVG